MTNIHPAKLPPMTALEFAVEKTFRHFFFGLRLALCWALITAPLTIAAYVLAFRDGVPDPANLSHAASAIAIAQAAVSFFATLSISVNWHRRILLDEMPRGLGWVRLDGPVWRYLGVLILVVSASGALAGAAGLALLYLTPTLEPSIGAAAALVTQAIVGLLVLGAIIVWYRLSTKLPAAAIGRRGFQAWRATGSNTMRLIGFVFWLAFTLAICSAVAAGAILAMQNIVNPWVSAAAIAVVTLLSWLSLFLNITAATSLYHYFGGAGSSAG